MTLLFFLSGVHEQWVDPGAAASVGFYEKPYKRKWNRGIGTAEEFEKDKILNSQEEEELILLLMHDFNNFDD